jgi:hypothetical protein
MSLAGCRVVVMSGACGGPEHLRTSGSTHGPFRHSPIPAPLTAHQRSRDSRRRRPINHHAGYLRDTDHVRRRPVVAHLRARRGQCHQQPDPRCLHRGAHTAPARGRGREADIQEGGLHAEVDGVEGPGAHFCRMSRLSVSPKHLGALP